MSQKNLVFDARLAGFIGVGELKDVGADGATIANMASRGLPMAIYVVRVATKAVNGDGCHEVMSLKDTDHTSSTARRHHHIAMQFSRTISYY